MSQARVLEPGQLSAVPLGSRVQDTSQLLGGPGGVILPVPS